MDMSCLYGDLDGRVQYERRQCESSSTTTTWVCPLGLFISQQVCVRDRLCCYSVPSEAYIPQPGSDPLFLFPLQS